MVNIAIELVSVCRLLVFKDQSLIDRSRASKLAEEEYKPTQGMTYFDVVKEDAV